MPTNYHCSNVKFRGFTLIELLATMSLILILIATVIPKIGVFGDKIVFNNRMEEIESLINQEISLLKNPEQGVIDYRVVIENDKTLALYNNYNSEPRGRVVLDSNERIFSSNNIKYLRCDVPFNDNSCKFYNDANGVVVSADQIFLTYVNDAVGSRTINVQFSPLMVLSQ